MYYKKGDYVIREGEEGNTFFIIAKGNVRYNKPILYNNICKDLYFKG